MVGRAQQHQPLVGVGHVVDVGQIGQVLGQLVADRHHQEPLRVLLALELDAERAAHRRVRAVRSDHPRGSQLDQLVRGADRQRDLSVVLGHPVRPVLEAHVASIPPPASVPSRRRSTTIGVNFDCSSWIRNGNVGLVGQHAQVERRDRAAPAVTELGGRRDEPGRDDGLGQAQLVEQLAGSRGGTSRPATPPTASGSFSSTVTGTPRVGQLQRRGRRRPGRHRRPRPGPGVRHGPVPAAPRRSRRVPSQSGPPLSAPRAGGRRPGAGRSMPLVRSPCHTVAMLMAITGLPSSASSRAAWSTKFRLVPTCTIASTSSSAPPICSITSAIRVGPT